MAIIFFPLGNLLKPARPPKFKRGGGFSRSFSCLFGESAPAPTATLSTHTQRNELSVTGVIAKEANSRTRRKRSDLVQRERKKKVRTRMFDVCISSFTCFNEKGSSHRDGLGAWLCDYRNSCPLDTCYPSNYTLGFHVPLSYPSPSPYFSPYCVRGELEKSRY